MDWSLIFSFDTLLNSVNTGTIVVLAALGCLMTEQAGMMNIGLDGIMNGGAFACGVVAWLTGSWLLGVAAGLGVGLLLGLFYGFMVIHLRSDEFVIGVTLNVFLKALTTMLYRRLPAEANGLHLTAGSSMGVPAIQAQLGGSNPINISLLVPVALLLVALCQIFLYRTRRGFWLRASGEHPDSLLCVGRSPVRMKYLASLACGAFCGLSGVYLFNYNAGFMEGISAERGFVAVACVIFGRANPVLVTLAALFFGLTDTVGMRLQGAGIVDATLTAAFPYVGTILMMIFLAIRHEARKRRQRPSGEQAAQKG